MNEVVGGGGVGRNAWIVLTVTMLCMTRRMSPWHQARLSAVTAAMNEASAARESERMKGEGKEQRKI